MLYWLLGYAAAVENRGQEWLEGILLNPRLGRYVSFKFDEILHVIGAGRTKVEALQLFCVYGWRRPLALDRSSSIDRCSSCQSRREDILPGVDELGDDLRLMIDWIGGQAHGGVGMRRSIC